MPALVHEACARTSPCKACGAAGGAGNLCGAVCAVFGSPAPCLQVRLPAHVHCCTYVLTHGHQVCVCAPFSPLYCTAVLAKPSAGTFAVRDEAWDCCSPCFICFCLQSWTFLPHCHGKKGRTRGVPPKLLTKQCEQVLSCCDAHIVPAICDQPSP